jgi:hypothetical protein
MWQPAGGSSCFRSEEIVSPSSFFFLPVDAQITRFHALGSGVAQAFRGKTTM